MWIISLIATSLFAGGIAYEDICGGSRSLRILLHAPGGSRTPNRVVRSHVLYPVELRVHNELYRILCKIATYNDRFYGGSGTVGTLVRIGYNDGCLTYEQGQSPPQIQQKLLVFLVPLSCHEDQ